MGNKDALLEKILTNTYTTSDAYKRLLVLEDVLQHTLFEKGYDTMAREKHLYSQYQTPAERATAEAVAAWGTQLFDVFNKDNLNADIQALKNSIEETPRLVLYAPVMFEAKHIKEISSWCRKNIDGHLLLDLRIAPQAAGGCILVWHDTLYDFSLRYFLKKRSGEFAKIIARYNVAPTNINAPASLR